MELAGEAADRLHEVTGVERHDVAIVLGSGWKGAADRLGDATHSLALADLPGFAASSVQGHGEEVCSVRGGSGRLLVFLGRTHLYEGLGVAAVVQNVRTAVAAGCRVVVLTNAAGAVDAGLEVGAPVLISDHISLTATSPLVGPQFVDLSDLYSKRLRETARGVDPTLREGVYAHWAGPAYETPAEIRMLRTLGADLVGMSTVPEAIAAHALGAEVLAISLVTNLAAGVGEGKLSHDEVLAAGEAAAPRCADLLSGVLGRLS